jgi:uncharacterized membrane-anchored protein YhcB (DUF1043 family)
MDVWAIVGGIGIIVGIVAGIVQIVEYLQKRRIEAQLDLDMEQLRARRDQADKARREMRERQRVVNLRPLDVTHTFKDRLREMRALCEHLADASVRLVSIVGRGGMGKTALASRVLADLERGVLPAPGEESVFSLLFSYDHRQKDSKTLYTRHRRTPGLLGRFRWLWNLAQICQEELVPGGVFGKTKGVRYIVTVSPDLVVGREIQGDAVSAVEWPVIDVAPDARLTTEVTLF